MDYLDDWKIEHSSIWFEQHTRLASIADLFAILGGAFNLKARPLLCGTMSDSVDLLNAD